MPHRDLGNPRLFYAFCSSLDQKKETRLRISSHSILHDLHLCPFQAPQCRGDFGRVGDDHGDQGVGVNLAMRAGDQGAQVDRRQPVGERAVMIGGQSVDIEVGVAVDEGGGRVELSSLAFDQGPASVIQLGLGRRPAANQSHQLMVDVVEGVGELVRLQRGGDRERALTQAGVEVAANAVGVALLLAELLVEP